MKMKHSKYYIGIILLCSCFLGLQINAPCCGTIHSTESTSNSELNINQVVLSYIINPFGEYYCNFHLKVLGNNFTSKGELFGQFKIFGFPIENFTLRVVDTVMDLNQSEIDTYTMISFSSNNFTIPEGTLYNISGSYRGKFITKTSNVYSFEIGVDWGCMVGSQHVVIRFKDDFTLITQGLRPFPSITTNLGIFELLWVETNVQSFQTQLYLRKTSNHYLDFFESWNATRGETRDVTVVNEELFPIEGNIFFPTWITANISYFRLEPSKKVCIHFEINLEAKPEIVGNIEIIINLESTIGVQRSIKKILIPVTIIETESPELLGPYLGILVLITFIGLLGVIFYKKDSLTSLTTKYKHSINKFQNSNNFLSDKDESIISDNSEERVFRWESIQSKWETILSENELKAIEILYNEGIMNQKSLAEKLGLTSMSVSRIISRLETKRLVNRRKLGISKMIKLKRDHLE